MLIPTLLEDDPIEDLIMELFRRFNDSTFTGYVGSRDECLKLLNDLSCRVICDVKETEAHDDNRPKI